MSSGGTVFIPPTREAVYSALFAKLQGAQIGGLPAFKTTGRIALSEQQLNGAEKPTLLQIQVDEEWVQNNSGLPYKADAVLQIYIFVQQPDDMVTAATQLNNLVDAALATLAPPFPGQKQTLGGLVEGVVLRGKCEYFVGMQGAINAFATFPVVIIMPKWQLGLG
jgi:hypothetical protein